MAVGDRKPLAFSKEVSLNNLPKLGIFQGIINCSKNTSLVSDSRRLTADG